MKRTFILKKLHVLLPVLLLALLLTLSLPTGCGPTEKSISKSSSQATEANEAPVKNDFPSVIPVYPGSNLVESLEQETNGKTSFKILFECKGNITELSQWYKQLLNKDWVLGSVSEGDMGDWSEFYAEARNEGYSLTVYLYQDDKSDDVAIEINAASLALSSGEPLNTGTEATVTESSQNTPDSLQETRIAFVCASVGAAWNIGGHFPLLDIKVYEEYQFDKGFRIREILDSDRPGILIIKECAAYFPPDFQGSSMQEYQLLIKDWVNLCREYEVIPVLTTVVPIDPGTNEGFPQLNSIIEFNDWIKQYSLGDGISVLDLEKALRISDTERALNPAYDSGDGLHPNDIAYTEKLDKILIPALETAIEVGH